ncbi:class 1 fructose-bisphosphatase [Haloarcula pelagica]|uniref:class 1 fructose-bisphosphatase n=1 Tax=Haloarcula pelagica TaxID=3033389 RepID=UPI0024C26D5B|nr:class 1 fructose-bisphosphatase [Halomicroarcula sp. YJ-61-S]
MTAYEPGGDAVDRIVDSIAETATEVREGLASDRTAKVGTNPSGERQEAADVRADELFEDALLAHDELGTYASEEREDLVDGGDGPYHVALDPLDGSSNLRSNNAMGTVFGIYDAPLPAKGRDLVAGGFVLYGPITTMVVARDDVVTDYLIEGETPQVLSDDITLPDDPDIYGFGGFVPDWPEDFTAFAREIEQELKLRYGGAMIADINQLLTYGGIFAYPGLKSNPDGKLRLQFEGNPIAFVFEAAGGASSDGTQSMLDVEPDGFHQRCPLHVGNTELIERLEASLD